MASRLPECWIAPDHLLDLRARVGLRHALVHERGEWQQRMQAVLYHHGLPKRADLLTRENRAWVGRLPLPAAGREQITVVLAPSTCSWGRSIRTCARTRAGRSGVGRGWLIMGSAR
jgi:hypothetical protein